MVAVRAEALQDFVCEIFVKAGCPRAEGERLGKSLVSANLAGHDSHGVARVPRYLEWLRDGGFVADAKIEVTIDTPVLAVVDGHYGFGQSIAPQAVEIGIRKCREMGLAAVALRNSGHVGRVGEWAEMAAEAGFVSIHFCNAVSSLLVAPFGGIDRRMSTAPYSIGIPRPGKEPLILDFATSVVAEGKVLVASQGGKKIPSHALIGRDGQMSGDPRILYGDYAPGGPRDYKQGTGAIRAFGDHKGSGLAFMVEVLGGLLTGTGAAEEERRWANGMLSIYIDPQRLDPEMVFPGGVERFLTFFKSSRPVEPGADVLAPGEPEILARQKRLAEGIPLPAETWAALVAAARAAGVDERRIQAAGAYE
ncbi:MAG: malate/lactate/ureidoglycolate dehydrogenase [Hyphomicrobiaceae bacterium]